MTNITTLRPGSSQPKEPARLIDANDVIQNVLDEIRYKNSLYTSTAWHIAKRAIDAAPTIDPESLRPTAHWISDSGGSTNVVCSAAFRLPDTEEFINVGDYYALDAVTHWMPLPKPPEVTP